MSKSTNPGMKAGRPSRRRGETLTLDSVTERSKMVRISLDLPQEEHTRLKLHALQNGRTIADVLRDLVRTIDYEGS